jgi:hypothetical protein
MIYENGYSADWPHYLRRAVEQQSGGVAIYVTGTLGGLITSFSTGLYVPAWSEDGQRLEEDGNPVYVNNDGEQKARSLGYELASYVVASLETAPLQDGALIVEQQRVLLPITNEDLLLAAQIGLVEISDHLVTDGAVVCGSSTCLDQPLTHVRIGTLDLVTIPGEIFPESSVGREESIEQYNEPWGEHTFNAITGYRAALPEGHVLIEIGLADNETGYLIPAADFFPEGHPNYYEETSAISLEAEAIIRMKLTEMLSASHQAFDP